MKIPGALYESNVLILPIRATSSTLLIQLETTKSTRSQLQLTGIQHLESVIQNVSSKGHSSSHWTANHHPLDEKVWP
jgi:hypothetical protein